MPFRPNVYRPSYGGRGYGYFRGHQGAFGSSLVAVAARGAARSGAVRARKYGTVAPKVKALRTKTKTMAKKHQKAIPLPNRSGSESFYGIKLKPTGILAKIEKRLPSSSYTFNNGAVLDGTANAGTQYVYDFPMLNSPADLGNIVAEVALTNVDPTIQNKTTRVFIKYCKQEVQIQNSSNAVCRIVLYNYITKRDGYGNEDAHTVTGLANFQDGIKDQTTSGTTSSYQIVGTKPTDSRLFNAYFKVKRVVYIDLAPGQVHYHRTTYAINREVAQEWLSPSGLSVIKGWSMGTMILAYGEPVADNSSGVTTAKIKLNTIVTKSYHYSWLQNSTAFTLATNNLSAVVGGNLENLVTGASAAFAAV